MNPVEVNYQYMDRLSTSPLPKGVRILLAGNNGIGASKGCLNILKRKVWFF
jgi:hypothetical protein